MIYFWCYANEEEEYESDRMIEAISPREAAIKATYMAMKEIGEQWEYGFPLLIRDETGRLSIWNVRVFMQPKITIENITSSIK